MNAESAEIAENKMTRPFSALFCLGVSSAGMTEDRYTRLTYDLTLAVATTLARLNPGMTFIYVSGMSTDSSERGRTMWARVKGKTENAAAQLCDDDGGSWAGDDRGRSKRLRQTILETPDINSVSHRRT